MSAGKQENSNERSRNFEQPSSYGSHIWNFLAQFGRCWTTQDQWLSTISFVTDCLNPSEPGNHGSGCDRCFDHWNKLLKAVPPDRVENPIEAGVWVHFIHNQVNGLATPPKKPISYNQAARTRGYGWLPLKDEEYFEILQKFGIKIVKKSGAPAHEKKTNRQTQPNQ